MSIMGIELDSRFHPEWIQEHPELRYTFNNGGRYGYNFVKKFSDGTRFDEFFVERLCEAFDDYGFDGLQTADMFCPAGQTFESDFSSEVFTLFLSASQLECPAKVATWTGDDREEALELRKTWVRKNCFLQWIAFHADNWKKFWEKVCAGAHAQGKQLINLGMYCTDPFETLYCLGVDQKQLVAAGVDYLMPNIVPTSLSMQDATWKRVFHRHMLLAMLSEAYSPQGKFLSLLGVRDVTEEWDVLHHAPCLLERDIYMLFSFMRDTGQGLKRSLDGLMMCLGDGIRQEEWKWLAERLEVADKMVSDVETVLSPKVVWSDAALDNTLEAYHETCRWTFHKWVYEMAERGALSHACVRIEDVPKVEGPLFIPNFDLLLPEEQQCLAEYKSGVIVATARTQEFHLSPDSVAPDFSFKDPFVNDPMWVFVWNAPDMDFSNFVELVDAEDNSSPDPGLSELRMRMPFTNVLTDTLAFRKVSEGFASMCSALLRVFGSREVQCSLPCTVFRLKNGALRIFILNPELNRYGYAIVTAPCPLKEVSIVTKYPILPVKYLDSPSASGHFLAQESDGSQKIFRVKVTPGGVTIVDVRF
jgi:hypothetical protein